MTKACTKCRVEKDVDEFYVHPRGRDGRMARCKECVRAELAEQRRRNPEPHRQSSRRWQAAHHDEYLAYQRAYREEFGEELNARQLEKRHADPEYQKRYNAWRRLSGWDRKKYAADPDHKARKLAKNAVMAAIRAKRLSRIDPCEGCGAKGSTEAHHYRGYAVEHRLDVIWLCRDCHMAAEAA